MATINGHHEIDAAIMSLRELPPYAPREPYAISSQDGEIIYIPLSKSAFRLLVTGKETEDAFAVVGAGGSQSDPIGFHYHQDAHDMFLCLKGSVNIWANDQCRTLGPGDFASIPPYTIHSYQILGDHSELYGLIMPGGWEEFFRFIGEPYSGPRWPMDDNRDFFEVLLPKLKAAPEKFDQVPCPQHKAVEPQLWRSGHDNRLPGRLEPYYLKNATGPAYVLGGMVCRPVLTTAESNGKFAIGSVEGSSLHHSHSIFANQERHITFTEVHHAFHVSEGNIEFHIDGSSTNLHAGELVYIPKDIAFRFKIISRFAKMYCFCNGGGVIELLQQLGMDYDIPVIPEKAEPWNGEELSKVQSLFGGLKLS